MDVLSKALSFVFFQQGSMEIPVVSRTAIIWFKKKSIKDESILILKSKLAYAGTSPSQKKSNSTKRLSDKDQALGHWRILVVRYHVVEAYLPVLVQYPCFL